MHVESRRSFQHIAVRQSTGVNKDVSFNVRPFPTPAYRKDKFADDVAGFLGLIFTLVYLWPVTRIVSGCR